MQVVSGNTATFNTVTANVATLQVVSGNTATFNTVTANVATLQVVSGNTATFDTVTANVATLQVVSGNTATFTAFTSQVGNVGLLFASTANVGDLDVAAGATFNGLTHAKADLTVDGNLTVSNLAISDRFITLNDGETANGVNGISGTYAGIRVDLGKYANGGNVPDAYMYYNSASEKWVIGKVGVNNESNLMSETDWTAFVANYYTRTQSDQKFATITQVNAKLDSNVAANTYAQIGDSYTKTESDARYIQQGNLTISDKVIVINNGQTGNVGATGTVGIQVDRGSIGADAALYFNESTDKWEAGISGSTSAIALESQLNGFLTTANAANTYATIANTYTKTEADGRYVQLGNVTLTDKVIVINNGQTGNLGATGTVGLQIDRGSIGADAALYFNETTDRWEAGLAGNVSQLATAADLSALAANNPYDLALSINGKLETGASYLTFVAPYNFTINFATSKAYAGTAPTGSHSILVSVNGTSVSTVTFAAGQNTGTLTGTTRAVTAGQVVTIIQSGTADAKISDVSIVLTGTKA